VNTALNSTLATIIAVATVTTAVMAQTRPQVPVIVASHQDDHPCGTGVVEGLDSYGDGFLDVKAGPGPNFERIDKLYNGAEVYVCGDNGDWPSVVYSHTRAWTPRCGLHLFLMMAVPMIAVLAMIRPDCCFYAGGFAHVRRFQNSVTWSRAGEHQQNGGSGDQEIAGRSDPERRVDAEGNAGDNSNARSENAGSAVDAPEPRRGAGADCRDQTHAGRKSKAHQEACWRQHKNTEAGANEEVCSIEVDEERGQPER
jgi:hypothetical protein